MELTEIVPGAPLSVPPLARRSALTCLLAVFVLGGYWSLRLAWADQLSRADEAKTIARAVRLSAGNADFRVKLARALDRTGADPSDALEAASALNPADARVWMRLGLNAEMHGNLASAERDLLQAARVSRRFEPRWTLANYYFRRNDANHMWPWTKEALLVGNGDLAPVFALCWNMSRDAEFILHQAIPERLPVLNAYLSFLQRQGVRVSDGMPVARKLAAVASAAELPALLAWDNRLLESSELPAALEIWNNMCARKLLPYAPLDPDHGVSLTDGSFEVDSTGRGFEWRLASVPGVSSGRNRSPQYFWVSFAGPEPEHCEPLWQYVALAPGAKYRLRFQYRTSEMAAQSGLRWQVLDAKSGAALTASSPWLSSPAWKDEQLQFTASSANSLARLVLSYQRPAGTPRIEGSLLLNHLRLERLP